MDKVLLSEMNSISAFYDCDHADRYFTQMCIQNML